jgi:DNA polymerase-3 subunit epsilon
MKEVILDTETTGLDIKDGHRIVEIGCIELENQIPTSKKFHCYLNPERKVSEDALKIHGYSDEFLIKQKKFVDICDDFLNFIKNKKLIIHNAKFDLSHINNELSIIGRNKIDNTNVVDTLDLAREKFPGSQLNLDALCKRFRIDNSKRIKHTAIVDCELLSKIYINLIDQKEPTLDFKNIEKEKLDIDVSNFLYCKKVISPSNEEIKKHNEFLKSKFNKNFF